MLHVLLTLALFLHVAPAWCSITKVEQLTSIKEILSEADANDLVVFDVDQTLIIPQDMLLRPCGHAFLQKFLSAFVFTTPEDRIHNLTSLMLLQRTIELVDQDLPLLISELQKRPCKTIALTAMVTGRLGNISHMEDWRYHELKSLGIDFSEAFPYYNHIVFGDLRERGPFPIFKNGILCSAKNTKGEVLEAFLHRVKWQPKRVFFIDDHLPFLESVQKHMNKADIDFIGIHYRAIDTFEDVFDENMAQLQLQHLIQKEVWISDVELKSSLAPKS